MKDKDNKLFAVIDQDTFLKLAKLKKLQSDWLNSLVEHACTCNKWRGENGVQK